jgi:hypothetical protein
MSLEIGYQPEPASPEDQEQMVKWVTDELRRVSTAIDDLARLRKTIVWAEENANLATGYVFSWGNGGLNAGLPILFDCTADEIGISCQTSTTDTIELYVNGQATGATVTLTAGLVAVEDISVPLYRGDVIEFYCVTGNGGGTTTVVSLSLNPTGD